MSLFLKLVTLPPLFVLSAWLLPFIDYSNEWVAVVTIAVLIGSGILIERFLLTSNTFWIVLVIDFTSAAFFTWFIASLFTQAEVTMTGALFLSIFISIAEYFVHHFLLIKEKPIASTL